MAAKLDLKAQKGALDPGRLDGDGEGDKPTVAYELWHGPAVMSVEAIRESGAKSAAAQPAEAHGVDAPPGFGLVDAFAFSAPAASFADARAAFADAPSGTGAASGLSGAIFADAGLAFFTWGEFAGFGSGLDLLPVDWSGGFQPV
jgi:hypothetical protein